MRLLSCRIQNVRRHRDLQLQFGERLTLIAGANESGKSTLVEALHKGLFLRATATGRGVDELRSRHHAGLPELEISFEAAAETWRLRKRFAGASGTCQLSNGRGLALQGAAAEEQLAALLGFEAPVEGRRIAQLPERWAHLWVRQGEAGHDPFLGSQERYDHARLIDQLQGQGGSQDALRSPLDQRVLAQLQQQLSQCYTATGRVKAGSALAEAQRRCQSAEEALDLARQQLAELETAMEQWRRINERLESIDGQQRPSLQRQLSLQQQTNLLQAKLMPLLQQAREQRQLQAQQQSEQREQQQLQAELEALLQQQNRQMQQREQLQQEQQATALHLQQLGQQQELLQRLLDLRQLEAEAEQLQAHQQELQRLQREADGLKAQLAALPEINAEQVRELRQAEQELVQATARLDAMAASLEVLSSDQRITLDGEALNAGERRLLQQTSRLEVGSGVVLQLSPGGGQALPQAREQLQRSSELLQQRQRQLQVSSSEEADRIERQRQRLEAELANLRKAARAIPWSGLQERLGALGPKRQRLLQWIAASAAAQEHEDVCGLNREQLELRQEPLQQQQQALQQQQQQHNKSLEQLERSSQQGKSELTQRQSRLAQLQGSLSVLAQRLENLARQQPTEVDLEDQQAHLQALLQELQTLQGQNGADAATALQALQQEKELLLNQRGQLEQRCSSLGATNPVAELEQRQAAWEEAEAERQAVQRRAEALRLLQDRFHAAQNNAASRYSEPLRAAIMPYLAQLGRVKQQPLLTFDPQQGFHDLQLQQDGEAFTFERLSGGMREQFAAAVRLAMAEVLKPAYNDVLPLVFDDAFTNSDRQRLMDLKQMLQRGMDLGIQIVLLTCHANDYDSLVKADTKNPPGMAEGIETGTAIRKSVVLETLG